MANAVATRIVEIFDFILAVAPLLANIGAGASSIVRMNCATPETVLIISTTSVEQRVPR